MRPFGLRTDRQVRTVTDRLRATQPGSAQLNVINYIARSLLETGGLRPLLHAGL